MKKNGKPVWGLLGPYTVWAFVFIVVPLGFVAYYAFTANAKNPPSTSMTE